MERYYFVETPSAILPGCGHAIPTLRDRNEYFNHFTRRQVAEKQKQLRIWNVVRLDRGGAELRNIAGLVKVMHA